MSLIVNATINAVSIAKPALYQQVTNSQRLRSVQSFRMPKIFAFPIRPFTG